MASILVGLKWFGIVLGKVVFVLVLPVAVAATLFGLPGSLLVIVDATIYSACHGWQHPPWWVLLVLVGIAVLAEVTESLLAFMGVKATGATTSTGVWVIVGGIAGVISGAALAPLLGLLGALVGPIGSIVLSAVPPIVLGLIGGYLGGYHYELRRGRSKEEAATAGRAALAGRLAGGVTKVLLVGVMTAIVLVTAF